MFLFPNRKYNDEIVRLKNKVNELQRMVGDPRYVIRKLLSKDISSYDWMSIIDKGVKKDYAEKAKQIIENPVFMNESKSLYGDLVKEIAMESQNFEIVRDLRMTINGVKLLEERLEKIGIKKDPTNKESFKVV